MEIRPKIWRDLTRFGKFSLDLATNSSARQKPKTKKRVMCGGGDRRDVWRGGGVVAWRVLRRGRRCGVATWKALWRGGLAGGEREK